MKKRNLAICIVGMAFCYILTISDVTTYAAENTDDSIQTETNYWNGNESEKTFSENTEKGILTTKYRVSVSKATMRSGPGTSYTSLGILYKNDIVWVATVYKGNIIKNLIMDCQSYTKYRPNETTGGIFVSWRRKEELPTGA